MKKKILILKLGALGDVVHTTVIATAIKQKHPDWQIDFLTTNAYANVIVNHPHIDNVIFWDASKRKSYKYLFQIASELFKNRYDVVFNLTRAFRNSTAIIIIKYILFFIFRSFHKIYISSCCRYRHQYCSITW